MCPGWIAYLMIPAMVIAAGVMQMMRFINSDAVLIAENPRYYREAIQDSNYKFAG